MTENMEKYEAATEDVENAENPEQVNAELKKAIVDMTWLDEDTIDKYDIASTEGIDSLLEENDLPENLVNLLSEMSDALDPVERKRAEGKEELKWWNKKQLAELGAWIRK